MRNSWLPVALSLAFITVCPTGCSGESTDSTSDAGLEDVSGGGSDADQTHDARPDAIKTADGSEASDGEESGPPVITTQQGPVEGRTVSQADVWRFYGIPYARPPIGPRRWKPPQPPQPRDERLVADTLPPACPQDYEAYGGTSIPESSEDCLHLNIWTASNPSEKGNRPVMVWIHGGGLVQGSAGLRYMDDTLAYDGTDLAQKGAVVVTIEYRLGPLGFMAHPSFEDESGNAPAMNLGIRDQIRALKWVESNIEAFGGDPDNVTVFGESAGAISICGLMTSSAAQGLFDRAIMQSGYCATERQMRRPDSSTGSTGSVYAQGKRYAEALGCAQVDDVESCLREASADELIDARQLSLGSSARTDDVETFSPIIDGDLFTKSIWSAFQNGETHDVPLIAGANADEWRLFVPQSARGMTTEAYETRVETRFPDNSSEILGLYPAADYDEPWHAWAAIFTDSAFVCPTKWTAATHAQNGHDAYTYLFSHVRQFWANLGYGSFHGAEMAFVFHDNRSTWTDASRQLAGRMTSWWYQFARDGSPATAEGTSWPSYGPTNDKMLELNGDQGSAPVENFRSQKCQFWTDYAP